jgi:uncharacterized protein YecT (DUF1311 family)
MATRHFALVVVLMLLTGLCGLLSETQGAFAAGKHPIDIALDACLEKNSTTVGINECLSSAYKAWDRELNAAYKDIIATLSPEAKAALKTAQRNWITYKDAQLKYFDTIFGTMDGTIWPSVERNYSIDLLRKRAIQLRCYAKMTNLADPPDPLCPQ